MQAADPASPPSVTTPAGHPARRALPPPSPRRWWSGLFWKCLLGMLAASLVGTVLLTVLDLFKADQDMREQFAPEAQVTSLRRELNAFGPLPAFRNAGERPVCEAVLQALLTRAAHAESLIWRDEGGADGAARDGRLALRYERAGGGGCQYPAAPGESLRAAMAQVVPPEGAEPSVRTTTLPSGWIQTVALRAPDDPAATLTLGMQASHPLALLWRTTRPQLLDLFLYLLIISAMSALALAVFLVRRIRRAERAAEAWAAGELATRINDRGGDEIGRLSQRFDHMADALGGVIEVKQALAAAEERNRLARDLHDTAKQRSFALGLQLTVLRHRTQGDAEQHELVETSLRLATMLQHDLSDIIQRFGGPTIAEQGLTATLRDSLELMLRGSGIAWTLILAPAEEARLCALPKLAGQLLLIATEAAANALRHSGASHLQVRFERYGEQCRWSISDDGHGFDPDRVESTGMGLANIRLRAQALPQGRLELYSRAKSGTMVLVMFRLAGNEEQT